jgi:hypothetical protein
MSAVRIRTLPLLAAAKKQRGAISMSELTIIEQRILNTAAKDGRAVKNRLEQ